MVICRVAVHCTSMIKFTCAVEEEIRQRGGGRCVRAGSRIVSFLAVWQMEILKWQVDCLPLLGRPGICFSFGLPFTIGIDIPKGIFIVVAWLLVAPPLKRPSSPLWRGPFPRVSKICQSCCPNPTVAERWMVLTFETSCPFTSL